MVHSYVFDAVAELVSHPPTDIIEEVVIERNDLIQEFLPLKIAGDFNHVLDGVDPHAVELVRDQLFDYWHDGGFVVAPFGLEEEAQVLGDGCSDERDVYVD